MLRARRFIKPAPAGRRVLWFKIPPSDWYVMFAQRWGFPGSVKLICADWHKNAEMQTCAFVFDDVSMKYQPRRSVILGAF